MSVGFGLPLIILSAAILFAANAECQSRFSLGWEWQNPLPQGNPLYSIHFAKDKLSGFAVGSDNTILRTRDGGFRWQRQTPLTDVTFSGVYVFDEKNAIVVGSRGTVLITTDGGKEWKPVPVDARDHLYGITFAAGPKDRLDLWDIRPDHENNRRRLHMEDAECGNQ